MRGGWTRRGGKAGRDLMLPAQLFQLADRTGRFGASPNFHDKPVQFWRVAADVGDVDQVSEYLPMFLAEGREHLQELNLAVVRIEETPDDRETVDEIFRIAHSLKGMSATMGFAGMAALTHEMEDVFELPRPRKHGLQRAEIDVCLECLDALEAAVDAIETGGAEEISPEPLIERLRALVRDDYEAPDDVAAPSAL